MNLTARISQAKGFKKAAWAVFALACFLFFSASAHASSETFTTGKDWTEKMSEREKLMSLVPPYLLYQRGGVNFQKSVPEYIDTMDRVLLTNPYIEKEDVSNIFASTVYAFEPENRTAFRLIEAQFEYKRTAHEGTPGLSLRYIPELPPDTE